MDVSATKMNYSLFIFINKLIPIDYQQMTNCWKTSSSQWDFVLLMNADSI